MIKHLFQSLTFMFCSFLFKILIFDFVPESNSRMLVRQSKEGEQLGEYFGASIASVDLNRDSFDELLVGAPQHSIQPELSSKSGDEGKVYVYLNRNGVLRESMSLYGKKLVYISVGLSRT